MIRNAIVRCLNALGIVVKEQPLFRKHDDMKKHVLQLTD